MVNARPPMGVIYAIQYAVMMHPEGQALDFVEGASFREIDSVLGVMARFQQDFVGGDVPELDSILAS